MTKSTLLQSFRCCTLLCLLSIRIDAAQNEKTKNTATQEAFIQAVIKGDATTVNRLLKQSDITMEFLDNYCLLGRACDAGHANIAKTLIDKGVGVNIKYGRSPVYNAIEKDLYNIVRLLINKGATLTSHELCNALSKGDKAKDIALLITQKMIANNWDINAKDSIGQKPLPRAVKCKNYEIVKLLVNNNADIAAKDSWDNTAFHYIVDIPKDDPIVTLLMDKIKGQSDTINTLKIIQNSEGDTPLHVALKRRDLALAKPLIEAGFVNNIKNYDGNTPFHIIADALFVSSPTKYAITKLLIEKGGCNHIQNNHKKTPIALVMKGSSKEQNKDITLTMAKKASPQDWQAILGDDTVKKGIQDLGINPDTGTDAERPMFTRKEVWVVSIMVVIGLVIWGMASQEASEEAPKIGSQEKLKRKPNKKVKNKVNKKHAQTTRSEAQSSSVV